MVLAILAAVRQQVECFDVANLAVVLIELNVRPHDVEEREHRLITQDQRLDMSQFKPREV